MPCRSTGLEDAYLWCHEAMEPMHDVYARTAAEDAGGRDEGPDEAVLPVAVPAVQVALELRNASAVRCTLGAI